MRKFLEEDMYLDELKDRFRKIRKRSSCGRNMHIAVGVIGLLAIGCLIGWLITLLVKKMNNDECDCFCDCDDDDDFFEDEDDEAYAHDDDFE